LTLKCNAVDFTAHEYTAEIGFQGANLDVDFLTSFLDLTPSMTRKKRQIQKISMIKDMGNLWR